MAVTSPQKRTRVSFIHWKNQAVAYMPKTKIDARSRCAKATCRRLGSVMVRSFSCKLPGRGRTTTGASSLLVKPWIPGRASDNESDVSPHRPGTAEKGKGGPTCARQIGQPLTSSLET